MAKKKTQSQSPKIFAFIIVFLLLGGLLAIKSGVIKSSNYMNRSRPTELAESVSIKGMVKVDDLKLSGKEIKTINRTVFNYRKVFTKVNVTLDFEDKSKANTEVVKDTALEMYLVLDIDKECQVQSWGKCVSRAEFVPQMVRYIERAARQLEVYKTKAQMARSFKRLYI